MKCACCASVTPITTSAVHRCNYSHPYCHAHALCAPTVQRLQQSGELVEQHTDPFSHALARQQHGATKADVDAAVADGKIPLLLTDVEGAQAARATGLDCLCIFLAPASPQVLTLPQLAQHEHSPCMSIWVSFKTWCIHQWSHLCSSALHHPSMPSTCNIRRLLLRS